MPRIFPTLTYQADPVSATTTLSPSLIESVAGFSAGIVSTLAVHPFDIVKTRLQIDQSERSRAGGSLRVIRKIVEEARAENATAGGKRSNGGANVTSKGSNGVVIGSRETKGKTTAVARAFYRGLMPNMIGNSVSWALYFMFYGSLKDTLRSTRAHNLSTGSRELSSGDYFLASGLAGIATAILTNPIWVIKTRMLSTARNTPGAYRGITHGTLSLFREEGLRGFYRGLVPSLFGVSHGAIQFMAYESLKNSFGSAREGGKTGLTNLDFLALSALSKIFAGSLTYPYQVLRSRLQTYDAQAKYSGVRDVVAQVWKREGLGGFYKGVVPNIVRVLPSTCVTFLVYENVKFYLPRAVRFEEG